MSIYCFNKSTALTTANMGLMINAINMMLPAFCTAWSLKQYRCVAAPANLKPGSDMYCAFLDNSDSDGSLAYHTEFANVPYGTVFVKTILQYGGVPLYSGKIPTIAQAFSHEIFEMIVNQNVNVWWQQSNGALVPAEVCDPVQSNIVPVKVGSVTVGLSDYVLPEWNDPQSRKGPYNFLNTLVRPFQVAKGGYLLIMQNGITSYVFGEKVTPYAKYRAENVLNYFSKYATIAHVPTVPTAPTPVPTAHVHIVPAPIVISKPDISV